MEVNPFWCSAGFCLGAIFINIFLCDLFSVMSNVNFASYADDSAPYVIGDGVIQIIEFLKEVSDKLFCWFANNRMKENLD